MKIIEAAGEKLGIPRPKSLVEKMAERLQPGVVKGQPESAIMKTTEPAAEILAPPPAPEPPKPRRQTRNYIDLDLDHLRKLGIQIPGDPSSTAEEVRLIKRRLLQQAFAGGEAGATNNHLILVTSATPGEGKTFVASNLAISMASERDIHVLLIDADVVRPTIPEIFGFTAGQGLIDLVEDKTVDMADILIRTSIPNLSILPSGRHSPLATELLASARMAQVVDDIANRYKDRVIIFDSPPLLVRSEPNVLAAHVGQIVMVVQADRTSQDQVKRALHLLEGNKVAGLVLNKVTPMLSKSERANHYYYSKSK